MNRSEWLASLAAHPVDPADVDAVEEAAEGWCRLRPDAELWEWLGWDRVAYFEWVAARPVGGSVVVEASNDAARWSPG